MTRFRRAGVAFGSFIGTVLMVGSALWTLGHIPAAFAADPQPAAIAQTTETVAPQLAQTQPEFSEQGIAGCLDCHDETEEHPVLSIFKTAHAQMADKRTPFAQKGCESCHGPSRAHADKPRQFPTEVNFGPTKASPPEIQNKACMACHEGGLRMHWQGSQHDSATVSCTSCHDVHTLRDKVQSKTTQAEVCVECHRTQKAQMFRFSRHPIKEGKVVCTDCHNPHGSVGPKMLQQATVNDTCYECHAEKRGPFLWEHAPVRDNCTTCHTPHGSSQPRLLKVRGPLLCQQCHLVQFHPSTLYSGAGVPPLGAQSRLLAKNCLNCHPVIHGSNHPSGARFLR